MPGFFNTYLCLHAVDETLHGLKSGIVPPARTIHLNSMLWLVVKMAAKFRNAYVVFITKEYFTTIQLYMINAMLC